MKKILLLEHVVCARNRNGRVKAPSGRGRKCAPAEKIEEHAQQGRMALFVTEVDLGADSTFMKSTTVSVVRRW